MAPELVAGGGYGGLIREKAPLCGGAVQVLDLEVPRGGALNATPITRLSSSVD